jgi:glucosamine--fructose-6-phosphate aminotransferase (isomerizing)
MCGIVGILGKNAVAGQVVDALKRLEYRGYDSAGVATLVDGRITRRRAPGKLRNLQEKLERAPLEGEAGIGHTRWATHGAATEANAHPHAAPGVAVVHNGIIENYLALRAGLLEAGAKLDSDTDTEVVAHLVSQEIAGGATPEAAVAAVLPRLKGAFALAFLFDDHPDLLIGARLGSPLAIGHGEGEMYLGSDAIALSPFTDRITYLEEGDRVVLTRDGATIRDSAGTVVDRPMISSQAVEGAADKGNYRHFMAKEIHEQAEVSGHTLSRYLDLSAMTTVFDGEAAVDFTSIDRLVVSACGTAYYAGLVAKYWFEKIARLPVDIDVASEFRYREAPLSPRDLALFVSQSGETADTLACLRYCKGEGVRVASIVNVPESTIARESDLVFPTLAGREIGVASTKAFVCQLAVLAALAVHAGRQRGHLDAETASRLVRELGELPSMINDALACEAEIEALAQPLSRARDVLYLGRGTNYPLALEGALKLKEISYIHAEGYAAGELKHGPIALIDEDVPVVVIAPFDAVFEKTVSNMEEVAARGGKVILITDEAGASACGAPTWKTIVMPNVPDFVAPVIFALPVQLLAYHTAVFMGTDVDQPRNLAKSVTVE